MRTIDKYGNIFLWSIKFNWQFRFAIDKLLDGGSRHWVCGPVTIEKNITFEE